MTAPAEGNNDRDGTFELEFDELLRTNAKRFQRLAFRFVKNHHDAQDIVQNAIVELLERRAAGEMIANPTGFLITAIAHKAIDAREKRDYRNQFHVNKLECDGIAAPDKDDGRFAEVRAAMDKMKPKLVDALNLCYLEGYSIQEAAGMLNRHSAAVATDLYRARFQVRRLIRIQEKKDEAQKNQRKGISGTGLADPSGA